MRYSAALAFALSFFAYTASATQKSEIRSCGIPGGKFSSPIVGLYNVFDDEESICNTKDVNVDWNAGARFEVSMFGTRCMFHTETKWSDVSNGDKFGYVNCPGMKNIPAIRDEKDYSGWCGLTTVGCRNRAVMTWDGCLSCGKMCYANSDCDSACCDKDSNICSSPENSTCM